MDLLIILMIKNLVHKFIQVFIEKFVYLCFSLCQLH